MEAGEPHFRELELDWRMAETASRDSASGRTTAAVRVCGGKIPVSATRRFWVRASNDGEIGAAGSKGRDEANLFNLCSFLIVEEMRRGKHPKGAGLEALRRVQKNTIQKRLLNSSGLPNFGLNFYVLNAKGEYAGVSMYEATYGVERSRCVE